MFLQTHIELLSTLTAQTRMGVLKLIFDGLCTLRSKPLPVSKDFSPSKNGWFDVFNEIFTNQHPFVRVFLPQKWLILHFFPLIYCHKILRNACMFWAKWPIRTGHRCQSLGHNLMSKSILSIVFPSHGLGCFYIIQLQIPLDFIFK